MKTTTSKRTDPIYQAQAILAARDHSTAEITLKLKKKGFDRPDIANALVWLEQHKLLNDQLFAERYIESALRRKPVGPLWLKAKLRQKGVSGPVTATAMAKLYPAEREHELAKQAAEDFARRSFSEGETDPAKLYRFLISRGFSPDVIVVAIS